LYWFYLKILLNIFLIKKQQRVCKARLPEEPNENEKNTTRLKIRLPDDEGILMRRFRISDTLQVCFLFKY
jgi:hypothetical protein